MLKIYASSAKCFCKILAFLNKVLGNIKGTMKFELFLKYFSIRKSEIIFHS